jgi:hypothetical protein
MNKLFTYALAIAVCLGTTALFSNSRRSGTQTLNADAQLANDGAFRDGLYLGRLAAQSGRHRHPLIGRWSNERDRASFAVGYERGYSDLLASAK